MVFEGWERNSKGELIPQEIEVVNSKIDYDNAISLLKDKLSVCDDEIQKVVLEGSIEEIMKLSSECERISVLVLPLLPFEINNIGRKLKDGTSIGLDGFPKTDYDIYADICSNKCVKPLLSYDEWKNIKDPYLRDNIALEIKNLSIPQESEEEKKKLIQSILAKALSK